MRVRIRLAVALGVAALTGAGLIVTVPPILAAVTTPALTTPPCSADGTPIPCMSRTSDPDGLVRALTGSSLAALPACTAEDGSSLPCYWDRNDHGNGDGSSFAAVEMLGGTEQWFIYNTGVVVHHAH
jgi:hypothetical protein